MSAITDDEIAQHPIPGPHGSRRWCCDECSWKYEERLRERVRADAAKLARLEAVVDRVHTIAMSSATDEEITRLETPYDDDAIDPPECAVCGHEFIFELGAEVEVAVCHDCASEALPRLLKRVRADAAKIARLEKVAIKALPVNGKCSHGIAGRTCSDAVEELRVALSALAPGDLGGEGM